MPQTTGAAAPIEPDDGFRIPPPPRRIEPPRPGLLGAYAQAFRVEGFQVLGLLWSDGEASR